MAAAIRHNNKIWEAGGRFSENQSENQGNGSMLPSVKLLCQTVIYREKISEFFKPDPKKPEEAGGRSSCFLHVKLLCQAVIYQEQISEFFKPDP
ncbi:hypothetical protein SCFA_2070003 [anaerobic digester metagenome]|uniref:Uncharacterized protein n=1 Tax=anaerobic digester metagenome TaxID=1263854 RepID=A0A485LXC2_9ZZZZ